jgi:lactate dehydrogenase-like 2-hydroxyacid dehydrogenase
MQHFTNPKGKVQSFQFSVSGFQWQTPRVAISTAKLRVAVLGVGSLGQHHARLYAELEKAGQVEFAGIFDAHADTVKKIAAKHSARVFNSIAEAAENSDALIIVTPTVSHFEIAKSCSRKANTFSSKNR